MSEAHAELICDAISILTLNGIMDYNGHASIRSTKSSFQINSGASDRAAMTPDQVCLVDVSGELQEGDAPPNEVHLHAAIYASRPDVNAIAHGHPKWSTLFSLTNSEIPVVMPQGCLVADLPIYPYAHSISSSQRGSAVADVMGARCGALLAGHGSVFAGETVQEAVALAIYTEQNAERAYFARPLGDMKSIPSEEHEDYRRVLAKPNLYQKCWVYNLSQRS